MEKQLQNGVGLYVIQLNIPCVVFNQLLTLKMYPVRFTRVLPEVENLTVPSRYLMKML